MFGFGSNYLLRQTWQEDLTGIDFYLLLGGNNTTIVGTAPVFTRASIAYGESSGTVRTVESGAMRNLAGPLSRGVLIESAHLGNVVLHSDDYSNGYWEKGTRNDQAAFDNWHVLPDGTMGQNVELKEGAVLGTVFLRTSNPTLENSTKYLMGVFCGQGNTDVAARRASISFHSADAWAGDYTLVLLDFETGVVSEAPVGTPVLGSPVLEKGAVELAYGWWFLWAIATSDVNASTLPNQNKHLVQLVQKDNNSFPTGNDSSSCLFCWPQLIKADGFRTTATLEQTGTTPAFAQAADTLSYAGSNYKQAYGSLFIEFYIPGTYAAGYVAASERMIYSAQNATDHLKAYLDTNGDFVFTIVTGGVTRTLTTPVAISAGVHRFAIDFGNEAGNTTDVAYLNGDALALTTNVNTTAAPATVDTIYIGQDSTGKHLNGTVEVVKCRSTRQGEAAVRFASGGFAWIPDEATTPLALWFDADELVLADGANVTTWPDLSGNSRDLTNAGGTFKAPIFRETGGVNSHAAVEFNALGSPVTLLRTAIFTTIAQPTHKFLSLKQRTWVSGRVLYTEDSVSYQSYLRQFPATPSLQIANGAGTQAITGVSVGAEYHLLEILNDGSTSTVIVDDNAPIAANLGTTGMDSFTLGALYTGLVPSSVSFTAAYAFSGELAGADLTNMRAYLKAKFGVVTS